MKNNRYYSNTYHKLLRLNCILVFCLIFIVCGCKTISPESESYSSFEIQEQRLYKLSNISGSDCIAILSKLGFDKFANTYDPNSIIVTSTPESLFNANIIIDLVDAKDEYAILKLGSTYIVRNLPSNSQLASTLGDINIGTFSQPPRKGRNARAIIDIIDNSVFALIPASYQDRLVSLLSDPDKIAKPSQYAAISEPETNSISDEPREVKEPVAQNTNSDNVVTDESIPVQTLSNANTNTVYAMSDMGTDEEINSQTDFINNLKLCL